MATRVKAPNLTAYVVRTGLTTRLVRATDAEHAERLFLASTPMLRNLKRGPGDIVVRRAAAIDVEAFSRKRARPAPNLTLDLDPDTMLAGTPFVQ